MNLNCNFSRFVRLWNIKYPKILVLFTNWIVHWTCKTCTVSVCTYISLNKTHRNWKIGLHSCLITLKIISHMLYCYQSTVFITPEHIPMYIYEKKKEILTNIQFHIMCELTIFSYIFRNTPILFYSENLITLTWIRTRNVHEN